MVDIIDNLGDLLNNDSSYSSHYNIKLEKFEGPLDLLLFLIKKNELDICDVPIALITKQYLEYINLMKELNLEVAGDFLVMASTLIQIKSSMLLPSHCNEDTEEETPDPRAELIRRLLDYSRYKEVAQQLQDRKLLGRDYFARTFFEEAMLPSESSDEPLELELFALIEAFQSILARAPRESFHEVGAETISIAERINEILSYLQEREQLEFHELFEGCSDRDYLVATFLAVLELCKLKLIRVRQLDHFGTIRIVPAVLDTSPSDEIP